LLYATGRCLYIAAADASRYEWLAYTSQETRNKYHTTQTLSCVGLYTVDLIQRYAVKADGHNRVRQTPAV